MNKLQFNGLGYWAFFYIVISVLLIGALFFGIERHNSIVIGFSVAFLFLLIGRIFQNHDPNFTHKY